MNLDRSRRPEGHFSACISCKLGDDNLAEFWNDQWIGNAPLSAVFSIIYAGSELKSGKVAEFGEWNGVVWRWKEPWLDVRDPSGYEEITP